MQKRSPADQSPLAFVPFSWEEKPGVPKPQDSSSTGALLLHFPPPLCMPTHLHPFPAITPLRKPPRLQQDLYGPLCKTPSFNSISAPPRSFSSKLLQVRRQSFDNIIYDDNSIYGDDRPLTKECSYESFIVHQSWNARCPPPAKAGALIRLEDDPFFMAIQACRKEPIRAVFYHHDRSSTRVCEEAEKAVGRRSSHGIEEGFKHLTIQQLFSQQSQEQEEEQHLQKAQTQPFNDEKKHANGLLTCVIGCFGCC